jgi:glycosyltransferase involved in cell wall biosynthesis
LAGSRPSALVYGDVDLNLLDGSAIWVQGVTQALVAAGCAVTVVLKAPVRTDRLIAPLRGEEAVTIRSPHAEALLGGLTEASLTVPQAVAVLSAVDAAAPHDLVVLRGRNLVSAAAKDGSFDGRLWTYLTDVPQSVPAMTPKHAEDLAVIAKASRYLLCQTEDLRCFLEGSVPAACGKSVLFPPVLPAETITRDPERTVGPGSPLRLVYTGKFAPRWNTLEMTQLPSLLASRGVPAEVHMVGDKVHDDPKDSSYKRRMRAALGEVGMPAVPGVIWHGGQSRAEAMRLAASGDIGLSWRHPDLDASLELSTKVLEFGQLGLPVILNRTPAHEALLGADYPLFAASLDDVADVAAAAAASPEVFSLAASRTSSAAAEYTLERAAERLRGYLSQAVATHGTAGTVSAAGAIPGDKSGISVSAQFPQGRALRVVIAGHDLKFFTRLIQYFNLQPGLEVRVDQWAALGEHDEAVSKELAEWADVVICEWCGPNAIWYSRHKRRGSRLLVHLHRFELYSHYPGQVKIGNVDQVICVSDHYTRLTREHTGWPASKVVTVPNPLDVSQLDRVKLDGAAHHLGLIGIVPSRKRLDLALDVLEELRRDDDRYLLYVKGGMPWEHWWVWQNPAEREHYSTALRRVQRSPLLRDAVVFDDAGPDVPAWLRRIGFVLSTSDDESFHVAPAEGMASRAVPVIRHWPGAETIYDERWIRETPAEMAEAIAELSDPAAWRAAGQVAHEQVQAFELGAVCRTWHALLTADLTPASSSPAYELLRSADGHVLHARGQRLLRGDLRDADRQGTGDRPGADAGRGTGVGDVAFGGRPRGTPALGRRRRTSRTRRVPRAGHTAHARLSFRDNLGQSRQSTGPRPDVDYPGRPGLRRGSTRRRRPVRPRHVGRRGGGPSR